MFLVISSATHCPYCVAAKNELKKRNITFNERLVGADMSREEFFSFTKEHSGLQRQTVPQIFKVNGDDSFEHIGGYDDLMRFLRKS